MLRGLGYWFFYGQDRLGPWIEAARDYTQHSYVILAGYGLVVLSLLAAAFLRWRHRVFFVLLLFVGVVISVGAHPYASPTPLGALFKSFANSSTAGLALRSTGRAAPLVVLALAVFLGLAANAVYRWLPGARPSAVLAYAVPVLVGVLIFVNFPALVDGTLLRQEPAAAREPARRTGRRRSPRSNSGDHQTRILEEPGRRLRVVHVGQHGRPDHARPHRPAVRRARADPVRHARQRRSPQRDRSPAAGRRRRSGRRSSRSGGAWASATSSRATTSTTSATTSCGPEDLAAVLAATPGLGTADGLRTAVAVLVARGLHRRDQPRRRPRPTRAGRAGRGVPGHQSRRRSCGASRPTTRSMVSGDGEGLVDAAGVGSARRRGRGPLLRVVHDRRVAARARPGAGDVLVVTDNNRLRARKWTTVTQTRRLHRAGRRGRPAAHHRSRRRAARRVPGRAAVGADDDRSGRRAARRRDRVRQHEHATGPRTGPRPRSTAISRPRGARRASATPAGSASRSTSTARSRPTTSTSCSRSTGAPQPLHHERAADLRRRPARSTSCSTADSRTAAGQTITFPSRTFHTFSIRSCRPTTTGRTSSARTIPSASPRSGCRDAHATHDVRVDEVVQMPSDLLGALGCVVERPPARARHEPRRDPPGAAAQPAGAVDLALVHAPDRAHVRADRQRDGEPRRARRRDRARAAPGRRRRRRHASRRARSCPAAWRAGPTPRSTTTRPPRGRRRSTRSQGSGREVDSARTGDARPPRPRGDRRRPPLRADAAARSTSTARAASSRCPRIADQPGRRTRPRTSTSRSPRCAGKKIRVTIDGVRDERTTLFGTGADPGRAGRHRRARRARRRRSKPAGHGRRSTAAAVPTSSRSTAGRSRCA